MAYPLTTTLNRIWACNPCDAGKRRALRAAGKNAPDDEPITYQQIVEAVGMDDALWCCQVEPQHNREWRLFAVWCARQVQHLMADERSIAALDVAERHANGEATDEELAAAWDASWDASWAARAAAGATGAAARAATWATGAATWAARAATWATWATWAATWAARAAAGAAAGGAVAAWAAAGAAGAAAGAAATDAQRNAFIQLVTTGELPEIVRQEVQ